MPEIRTPLDFEAVAVSYLTADSELTALAGAGKVAVDLPRGWAPAPDDDPMRVRITRIGTLVTRLDPVLHLEAARLQIDGFAGTSEEASAVTRLALARLLVIAGNGPEFPGAVITDCSLDLGLQRRDDPTTHLPSYFAGVILVGHPVAV